jgi:hypothetical protein
MSHGHEIHIQQEQYSFNGKAKTLSIALLAIGILLTIVGIFTLPRTDAHHDEHAKATTTEAAAHHATEAHAYPGQNINGVDEDTAMSKCC